VAVDPVDVLQSILSEIDRPMKKWIPLKPARLYEQTPHLYR